MISDITGKRLLFNGQVLIVADSQRAVVEGVLASCTCTADWSRAVSELETYSDHYQGNSASIWSMSIGCIDDVKKVQSALDAIK